MSAPHCVIAGAGIAGLTAALCLARRGIAVTVVEKRTGFGELGAGLQIAPNSGRILDDLDLTLPLKRVAVSSRALTIRRWSSGGEIVAMPVEPEPGQPPYRLLKRNDLHTVLLDAVRSMPNIRLLVGRGVQEAVQDEQGVTVTLDGRSGETLSGIALIGADGGRSRIREVLGDEHPPSFTGYEAWRTVLPATGKEAPGVTLHLGSGRHAVHYPVAAGREINLVIIRQAQEAREGWSREGDPAILREHVAKASPALRTLAAAAPSWLVWSLFDRSPAVMAKGRVALIGDAAHPVLPFLAQGASLAIEDAAVLARHLAAALGSAGNAGVPMALAAFAEARAARAARVQEESRRNGLTYHLGMPLSLGRDLVLRRLGARGMRERYRWLYDWRDAG